MQNFNVRSGRCRILTVCNKHFYSLTIGYRPTVSFGFEYVRLRRNRIKSI
jgi:hypothetical protein